MCVRARLRVARPLARVRMHLCVRVTRARALRACKSNYRAIEPELSLRARVVGRERNGRPWSEQHWLSEATRSPCKARLHADTPDSAHLDPEGSCRRSWREQRAYGRRVYALAGEH